MNSSSSSSVDPFSKKDWYDVKAPAMFNIRNLGKTLVTRTQGTSKLTKWIPFMCWWNPCSLCVQRWLLIFAVVWPPCVFCRLLGIASDGLKGRVYEVSLADLQNDEVAFRKFKLIAEDVQGKNCLTNFHGMDLTRDKMCSMVKKWQVGRVLQRPPWYDAGLQFNCSAVGDLLPY